MSSPPETPADTPEVTPGASGGTAGEASPGITDDASPQAPPAITDDAWFGRIVYALVMDDANPATVEAMVHEAVVLRFPRTKSRALLLRYIPDRGPDMAERLRTGVRQLASAPLDVVLIGGPPGAHERIANIRPRFTRQPVSLHHLRDDGTVWQKRARLQPTTPLTEHLGPPQGAWPPSQEDSDRFAERVKAQLAAVSHEHEELGSFHAALRGRRPVATWALAAVILAVYGLELLWGAVDDTPAMVRMGALVPERIRDGEWWRLVSCTFLHGGFAHLAFNTFVLLMLGNVLERILGTSRFLVLYGTSALAGSLASFLAGDERISVGASGALWGLLAADAVLAFRPRGLLPAAMIERAKRAAVFNLILNVANSFRPQVDFAAHLGGGAMGALLLATGLLTLGLGPLTGPAVDTSSGNAPRPAPRGRLGFAAGAAAVVIVLAVGLGLALASGRPWALDAAPGFARRPIPALGLTAELPSALAPTPVAASEDVAVAVFGDLLADPVIIEIMRVPLAEPIAIDLTELDANTTRGDALAQELAVMLAQAPEGGSVHTAPARFQAGERPAARVVYQMQNGLTLERAVALDAPRSPDALPAILRVDVATWPRYQATYHDLARRILTSLAPIAQP
jgi:membrane associated rhomboid family serine protease